MRTEMDFIYKGKVTSLADIRFGNHGMNMSFIAGNSDMPGMSH